MNIDKILDGEETNLEFVVERFDMFDLNRVKVMESWAEEIDDLNLKMAIFLPQGGASIINFSAYVEETFSDNTLKSAMCRKLEEFEDGAKVGHIRTKSVGVVAGYMVTFVALLSQGGSSHRDFR